MSGWQRPDVVETVHPEEDQLVELALGQVPEPARGELTDHLAVCGSCRRHYDDLAGAVDLVLPAVPRVAPPAAFLTGVLDRLEAERASLQTSSTAGSSSSSSTATTTTTARPTRRHLLWAAAAGVLGLAAGAGATASFLRDGDEPNPWVAPLMAGEAHVGSVSRSYAADGSMLVVDLSLARTEGRWTCRLMMADGTSEDVGTWRLAEGSPRSWIVRDPGPTLEAVELVRADGTVWARAQL
ncbi:hypothetical protein [Ornithinimicrobium tianjinense]|uniref:Zinc-finger n=1 Tax=Ornithinimicrobium tianjinense TaxID=1195761 RepID=A0A917F4G9_9MICO|nr:hypothetical protein [Ornithinimicrobium tianjinense]GGF41862.1 hypothetical protein GCM10011366_06990 [Ornithinimicrobium tianjinense]